MFSSSFQRVFGLVLAAIALVDVATATQVMRRPDNYNGTMNTFNVDNTPEIKTIEKRATGRVNAAYFTNWGIYAANFQPTDINPTQLTHIIYAFADVDPSSGTISLTDSYADETKHFPSDSWNDVGNNLYGCLKQMYLLKLANRNLKVLLSVGGWTYSQDGHFDFVTSASSRATFVSNAISMIQNFGFDGIDIDFEYPADSAHGQGFADTLTALRTAMSSLQSSNGDSVPYEITVAVSAGASNYENLVVPQMDAAVSYWNLMAYDYAGSWLTWADNQANVYGGARTGVSTDSALTWYFAQGATPGKMVLGIPLYGHAFEDTLGLGDPYNGIGPGTVQAGIYDYKDLPMAGATVYENTTDITSYSYDAATEELVSYDTPDIVNLKAKYAISKGLAGTMFWELSMDKTNTTESLVYVTESVFGTLDQTQNHIHYPDSEWDNIKNNMGQGTSSGSSSTTSTSTSSPTSTTHSTTSTTSTTSSSPTSTSSGSCAGISAWTSSVAYNGGAEVTYGGYLWTASWWTEADTPGGSAGVWVKGAAC